jgi:hypothetical protein
MNTMTDPSTDSSTDCSPVPGDAVGQLLAHLDPPVPQALFNLLTRDVSAGLE